MTRDQIEAYSYTVNKHRMPYVPKEMLPKFSWGMRMRNEDVAHLITPEEGEKMDKDLTFKISKEIYKEFIKEDTKVGTFAYSDNNVSYTGKVDHIEISPSMYATGTKIRIDGTVEYGSPINGIAAAEALLRANRDRLVSVCQFEYKKIIYSNGVTTILWKDGTKTTVRAAEGEDPNPGAGIAYAFMKRALGNKNGHNKVLRKEVPAVLAAEKKRRVEKDRKRMDKDLKKYQKENQNGETENS